MPLTYRKISSLGEALAWYHFVPHSGAEGSDWYVTYRDSGCEALARQLDISVDLMRQRQVQKGKAMLDQCLHDMEALARRDLGRAVLAATEEACWGARAYYHYHVDEYEAAKEALDSAARMVSDVIDHAPFLVPFATRCYDFCLNHARIARGRRRWQDMWDYVEQGRAMLQGQVPLCQGEQREVYIKDAYAFYRSVTPLDDLERQALQIRLDQEDTIRKFERRAVGATLIPHVVIDL